MSDSHAPQQHPAPGPPVLTAANPGAGVQYDRFLDCVHCGLCTAACPTYLETGNENDSPRGRIYLMRAVTDGRLDLAPSVERHLDLCLDCRSCETACPSGVQYGRLIEPFRVGAKQIREAQSGLQAGWFERLFLYGLFPYPRRMRAALFPARLLQRMGLDRLVDWSGVARLLPAPLRRMYDQLPRLQPVGRPLPELLPALGPRRAKVGLFTGCVAQAMFPQTHWATARVLQANGCDVVIPRSQVCCGAIHYHSGEAGPALEFAAANSRAFDLSELDAVIVNVAGCGSMLKDYRHLVTEVVGINSPAVDPGEIEKFASKVQDASEFLAALGPVRPKGEIRLRAVYHDACHLVHAQRVREQPRLVLGCIPGLDLVPLPESEVCCGAAGSYNLTQPDMSERLANRKLQNILGCNVQAVITGNAGCTLQIQAALHHAGSSIFVAHPMEVLDWSYRGLSPPVG